MTSIKPLSFDEALSQVSGDRRPHLLLGNGFSRALFDDIFAYGALWDRADFSEIGPHARQAFEALETTSFEDVMRALERASSLVRVYDPAAKHLAESLRSDAERLREILVRTIASNHPEWPGEISAEAYAACRRFLSHFDKKYTLNYDLLLYWAIMQEELEPPIQGDDGFRRPEAGEAAYVTWEPHVHQQDVFYLHGALHLFDAGAEIQKYTWASTGVRLIDQVREAMEQGLFPLFVAEADSNRKWERIRHSAYLSRGERSLLSIGGTLFVYGFSMSESDDHVVRFLKRNRVRRMLVSLHGNPDSESNRWIRSQAEAIADERPPSRSLEVAYFVAESANVWT